MAKITVHGGPTDRTTGLGMDRPEKVKPWHGKASSASPEKLETSPEPKPVDPPPPAPTTESRSDKGRAAGSTARSTAGRRTKAAEE